MTNTTRVDELLAGAFHRLNYTPQHERIDLAQYRTELGICRFVREILGVRDVAPYQEDILRAIVRERRVSARGPHGLGKTALAAWMVLWAMTVFDRDTKCPTTASAWRQLEKFLWPEIRKWAMRAHWYKLGLDVQIGRELLMLSFKLGQKEAFAVASDNPALIEGAHASLICYVFDEAKAIPSATWDAAEGAFSGAGTDTGNLAFALAISTPGEPSGRFYDIQSRKPGYGDWWVRHVTLDEALLAGRISQDWVEARREQWGEESAVYQNRVLGEFAATGEDSVIPLTWVEQAVERWQTFDGEGIGRTTWGLDVARYGEDRTVLARYTGRVVEALTYWPKQDTMQTTGRVVMAVPRDQPIAVDVIGVGAGVFDRLRELSFAALDVNVGAASDLTDTSGALHFLNLRSALWWLLRDHLDPRQPDAIALPPDDRLIGDLVGPRWVMTSAGKIKVESKDDLRKRLGRSTDSADAVMLAMYAALRPKRLVEFV